MNFNLYISRISIIVLSYSILLGCTEPNNKMMAGDFTSMQSCLETIKYESQARLEIITDEPGNVSGNLSNGEYFGCITKVTGTKGIYVEGYYTYTTVVEDKKIKEPIKKKKETKIIEGMLCTTVMKPLEFIAENPKWTSDNVNCMTMEQINEVEQKLIEYVYAIPTLDVKKNLDGYLSLLALSPSDNFYKVKAEKYQLEWNASEYERSMKVDAIGSLETNLVYRYPNAGDSGTYFLLRSELISENYYDVYSSRIGKNNAYTRGSAVVSGINLLINWT